MDQVVRNLLSGETRTLRTFICKFNRHNLLVATVCFLNIQATRAPIAAGLTPFASCRWRRPYPRNPGRSRRTCNTSWSWPFAPRLDPSRPASPLAPMQAQEARSLLLEVVLAPQLAPGEALLPQTRLDLRLESVGPASLLPLRARPPCPPRRWPQDQRSGSRRFSDNCGGKPPSTSRISCEKRFKSVQYYIAKFLLFRICTWREHFPG